MRIWRNLSIKWQLFVGYSTLYFIIISIVGFVVYGLIQRSIEQNYKNEIDKTTNSLVEMVRVAAKASAKNYLKTLGLKNREIMNFYHQGGQNELNVKDSVLKFFSKQKVGKNGYILIREGEKIILGQNKGVGLSLSKLSHQSYLDKEGHSEFDFDGTKMVSYNTSFAPWGWKVSLVIPHKDLDRLVNLEDFRESIKSLRFAKTGYAFVYNSNCEVLVHPVINPGPILHKVKGGMKEALEFMCRTKNGAREYLWRNPQEEIYYKKLASFKYIPEYEWIVGSSVYLSEVYAPLNKIKIAVILAVIASFACILIFTLAIGSSISKPLDAIMRKFEEGAKGNYQSGISEEHPFKEATALSRYYNKFMNYLQHADLALANLAKQVAHDIRSPLSALDMMMSETSHIPEDKRIIIRSAVNRIQDISNDLLSKNRSLNPKNVNSNQKEDNDSNVDPLNTLGQKILLSGIIEGLLSEKRAQYRMKSGISIQSSMGAKSYGLFVTVNIREFKRVLSNLISNSVEAFDHNTGEVVVDLYPLADDLNKISLSIKDNGKGIPEDILSRLGTKGETFGKQSGNGLGIYHAKSTIESWGGELKIKSTLGLGTEVQIILPKQKEPDTFFPQVNVACDAIIVAIDDDDSIHQIWKKRFSDLMEETRSELKLFNLMGEDDLIKFNTDALNLSPDIYLIDYEFIGQDTTGLDLIKNYKLDPDKCVLVTSRFEEPYIIKECEGLGVKVMPKGLAGFVPIVVSHDKINKQKSDAVPSSSPSSSSSSFAPITNVLLDDDNLIRLCWKIEAKQKNIPLELFSNPTDLFIHLKENPISRDSIFYIDSELDSNVKGEDVALDLFELGYENLYMSTGHESDRFAHLSHLKGVMGKRSPF